MFVHANSESYPLIKFNYCKNLLTITIAILISTEMNAELFGYLFCYSNARFWYLIIPLMLVHERKQTSANIMEIKWQRRSFLLCVTGF